MTFKVATFNIWHGLNGDKSIKMDSLEPKGRKFLRLNYQRDILRALGADLIMLQEVNPCPRVSSDFAEFLNYDEFHQVDNAGIKLFGLGFPKKLFGGITILAKKQLGLKHLESVKLSGPKYSFCNDILSVQTNEHRYCLIAEINHPEIGSLLCANVHLHHGLEITRLLSEKIEDLKKNQLISAQDYSKILVVGHAAQERRLSEIKIMGDAIEQVFNKGNYQGVILAGDLNCTEESQEWQKIIELGFIDDNLKLNGAQSNFSWTYEQNKANHDYDKNFHYPWHLTKKFSEPNTQDVLRQVLMENEFRNRRIDYIFSKGSINQKLATCGLFANQPNKYGLVASDHFGVVSEFSL